jgi:hypothetical protein
MVLSVVVTIVDGGAALRRCLEALECQRHAPSQVLVPFDDTVPADALDAAAFPHVTFLPLGAIDTASPKTSQLGQHELFDRRRAAGLAAATGDLVAMLEDRGIPRPDWAASLVALHRDVPYAAVGGAVENGASNLLNWAVYFCDFGRYQRPFQARVSRFASDVNVSYKRPALESIRSVWVSRYHEPAVHDALGRGGETILLSPVPIVDQLRGKLRLGPLITERIAWGRVYACGRFHGADRRARLRRLAVLPVIPFVLFFRAFRDRLVRRRSLGVFLLAAPCLAMLLCAWTLGEAIGTLEDHH